MFCKSILKLCVSNLCCFCAGQFWKDSGFSSCSALEIVYSVSSRFDHWVRTWKKLKTTFWTRRFSSFQIWDLTSHNFVFNQVSYHVAESKFSKKIKFWLDNHTSYQIGLKKFATFHGLNRKKACQTCVQWLRLFKVKCSLNPAVIP